MWRVITKKGMLCKYIIIDYNMYEEVQTNMYVEGYNKERYVVSH